MGILLTLTHVCMIVKEYHIIDTGISKKNHQLQKKNIRNFNLHFLSLPQANVLKNSILVFLCQPCLFTEPLSVTRMAPTHFIQVTVNQKCVHILKFLMGNDSYIKNMCLIYYAVADGNQRSKPASKCLVHFFFQFIFLLYFCKTYKINYLSTYSTYNTTKIK